VAEQRYAAPLWVIKDGRSISGFQEGSDQVRPFTVLWADSATPTLSPFLGDVLACGGTV
jgi:hypothetical protein